MPGLRSPAATALSPRRAVLDMMDRRPLLSLPPWVPAELREALPAGWDLTVIEEPTDGSGDGATRVTGRVLEAVSSAEIYFGYGIPAALFEAGPGLRWVHSGAAGVGSSLTDALRRSSATFTNSAGIHGPPMAETVLAMILHFQRGLDFAVRSQARGSWATDPYYGARTPVTELSSSTVGIVGFGGVGREVAWRASALGARVIASKRTPPRDRDVASAIGGRAPVVGGREPPAGTELVHGPDGLDTVLRESDVVVLTTPETPETRGMIDARALARMRPGAVLVNVARGRIVEEDALVAALRDGRLRGAALDVFHTEPLPGDHPLWALDNVLITPHVSAATGGYWRRELDLILRNLERYLAGTPLGEWENVVDTEAGY